MPEQWFRNTHWDESIERAFRSRLKRSHTSSRGQYLYIQAITLLHADARHDLDVGLQLIDEFTRDYPDDFRYHRAHLAKAAALVTMGRDTEALESYLAGIVGERTSGSSEFALFVATRKLRLHYDRAIEHANDFLRSGGTLLPQIVYDCSCALALMLDDLGDHEEATHHALRAMTAFGATRSAAAKHPNVGLVQSVNVKTFLQLERLAGQATPTAVARTMPIGFVQARLDTSPRSLARRAHPLTREVQHALPHVDIQDYIEVKYYDFDEVRAAYEIFIKWLALSDELPLLNVLSEMLISVDHPGGVHATLAAFERVALAPTKHDSNDLGFLAQTLLSTKPPPSALLRLARNRAIDTWPRYLFVDALLRRNNKDTIEFVDEFATDEAFYSQTLGLRIIRKFMLVAFEHHAHRLSNSREASVRKAARSTIERLSTGSRER